MEVLEGKSDDEIAHLLNTTQTVLGNHLYHEAALQGNYDIIDKLLDQPGFECDPVNRADGDTPLHSLIRYMNSEPYTKEALDYGHRILDMMLEAGSDPRIKNKRGLTPRQLTDPRNVPLKMRLEKAEDDANQHEASVAMHRRGGVLDVEQQSKNDDDDAEFSGSDEEERADWERRRKEKRRG